MSQEVQSLKKSNKALEEALQHVGGMLTVAQQEKVSGMQSGPNGGVRL
jgi:hypothetical protein